MVSKKNITLLGALLCFVACAGFCGAEERVAYTQVSDDGLWQIWTMDGNGDNKRQITRSEYDKRDIAWVPSRQRIAFRTSNGDTYLVGLDGEDQQEVLKSFQHINNPVFRDDEVIFVRVDPKVKDKRNIWKSNYQGNLNQLLTKGGLSSYQPHVSPDGSKIVFIRADTNRIGHHVWTMNSDGSDPEQLTEGVSLEAHPQFSPQMDWVYFSSNRESGDYEIYKLALMGSRKLVRLTNVQGLETSPSVNNDGDRVLFVSSRNGVRQVFVMDHDGKNAKALTDTTNPASDPIWIE